MVMLVCKCLGDDPEVARKAPSKKQRTLFDRSHFSVFVSRCSKCGQQFLRVFMEVVDWEAGDDSQAGVRIPITPGEAAGLKEFETANEAELALRAMDFSRRKLWWVHPKGKEASTYWATGELVILPHD